ncbi:uncharacterized protein BDV14DRAFT_188903 [Aspergillus stella-maris]|uniref:uncharacterized protein n=1 Tax=Aspergillus stella-maris TaxID=1810926 RepID=UPI003CCD9F4D
MENTTAVPLRELPRGPRDSNHPNDADDRDWTRSRTSSMTALSIWHIPRICTVIWIITCWLSYRPIGRKSYRQIPKRYVDADPTHPFYVRSEHWFHAARVLQAITSVLTLPLTSAICATAAVIYTQRSNSRLMFGRVKFWTRFLLLAFVLNLLSLILAPLQAILVSSKTIKTPTEPASIEELLDLVDPDTAGDYNMNLITVMTRNALKTETLKRAGGATFNAMPNLPDPFLAELPSGFNTGLIRQFAPRITSTATYQNTTAGEFPEDCQSLPNGLFLEYSNITWSNYGDNQMWGVQVCMPGDITQSLWRATRDRQDFSEVLYLNVSQDGYISSDYDRPITGFYRLTLDTTAGYFELPNYMNGGAAGELLENDPSDLCRDDCKEQGDRWDSIGLRYHLSHARRQSEAQVVTEPTEMPYEVKNKGPLLTLALALFGEGSFIATRARNPSAYATTVPLNVGDGEISWIRSSEFCIDTVPLGWLFSERSSPSGVNRCVGNNEGGEEGRSVDKQIGAWLENFKGDDWKLGNDFTAAAFLTNREWLKHRVTGGNLDRSLKVSFDLVLGLHVLSLLALGVYSARSPRWTSTLDSFAMMRMGADILPELPMHLSNGTHQVDVLDSTPGFVGDATPDETVGKLGVGATAPIKEDRYFKAFHKAPYMHDPHRPPRLPGNTQLQQPR